MVVFFFIQKRSKHNQKDKAKQRPSPIQVGVAVACGAEAAVHTAEQWMRRNKHDPSKVFFKLDLKNAFNTVDRTAVLKAVREKFAEVSSWTELVLRPALAAVAGQLPAHL